MQPLSKYSAFAFHWFIPFLSAYDWCRENKACCKIAADHQHSAKFQLKHFHWLSQNVAKDFKSKSLGSGPEERNLVEEESLIIVDRVAGFKKSWFSYLKCPLKRFSHSQNYFPTLKELIDAIALHCFDLRNRFDVYFLSFHFDDTIRWRAFIMMACTFALFVFLWIW